jgi:transposase, IS30 family
MGTNDELLNVEERATILLMQGEGGSLRAMARKLPRAPSTIRRELVRNPGQAGASYDARRAGIRARGQRFKPRRSAQRAPHTGRFGGVEHSLREGGSPEPIAGTLQRMWPNDRAHTVSHETLYNALYVRPRGEWRAERIATLRQGRSGRRPRSRGEDRRGQIPDRTRLHARPSEIEDRSVPGHWEGDLIKGTANRSAVGTLVERSSRLVRLARRKGSTAQAPLEGFTEALNRVHEPMRKTLTYDQGKEMSRHPEWAAQTGVTVYFADPHSHGRADRTRTPTACCANICPREQTCPDSPRTIWMPSPSSSLLGPEKSMASVRLWRSTLNGWSRLKPMN